MSKSSSAQKNLKFFLTPQNLNPFQLAPPNWNVVCHQFEDYLVNFCS
jgi:hypothetical protein